MIKWQALLKDQERIDTHTYEGIKLIQHPDYFMMSLDAVLLADFIELPQSTDTPFYYLDFCTGNGVIPLILSKKSTIPMVGIEIQESLVDMARRSAMINQVEDRIQFIHQDLLELKRPQNILYDVISCNPPYFLTEASHDVHHLTSHAIARHEIYVTMHQWIKKARSLLKTKGKLFIVMRPERLDDLFYYLEKENFSIHRLRFVHSRMHQRAKTVLIEAIAQGGRRGVKIEPPLYVYDDQDNYTKEMMAIYRGRN